MLSARLRFAANQRHIWWGVSVEDKKYGRPRISHLQAVPAAVRFLSISTQTIEWGTVLTAWSLTLYRFQRLC